MPGNAISGFEELADDLEAAADALDNADAEAALDRAVEDTAEQASDTAQDNAPVDTGELRDSIHVENAHRPLSRWVVASADHARAVEYGTGPFTITPDEAEALRFEVDGEVVFAQNVDHPGISAQPYLRPALHEHRTTLRRNIREALRETLQGALEDR